MLDAPELQDDFYLNLVDWSAQNVLAVGLGSCVYLWSACTSQVSLVTRLLISDVSGLKKLCNRSLMSTMLTLSGDTTVRLELRCEHCHIGFVE